MSNQNKQIGDQPSKIILDGGTLASVLILALFLRRIRLGELSVTFVKFIHGLTYTRFINGRKTYGSSRKNINRSIEGYYLWASFKFLYRSASDIQAARFDTVDNPPNLSSNSKADRFGNLTDTMASTQSAAAITTDEKQFLSIKALPEPELSIKQIGSGSHQPPKLEPVKGAGETGNASQVPQIKEELQVVASAESTQVLDNTAVVVDNDQEGSEITRNQRYSLSPRLAPVIRSF